MKLNVVRAVAVGLLCMAIFSSAVLTVSARLCDGIESICYSNGGDSIGTTIDGVTYPSETITMIMISPTNIPATLNSPFFGFTTQSSNGEANNGEPKISNNNRIAPADSSRGKRIADMAIMLVKKYKEIGIKYGQDNTYLICGIKPGSTMDCSHFVWEVMKASGLDVQYVNTAAISGSSDYVSVTDPQIGDVVNENGHMGIVVDFNEAGEPIVAQMGNSGPAIINWNMGGSPAYYRPSSVSITVGTPKIINRVESQPPKTGGRVVSAGSGKPATYEP